MSAIVDTSKPGAVYRTRELLDQIKCDADVYTPDGLVVWHLADGLAALLRGHYELADALEAVVARARQAGGES